MFAQSQILAIVRGMSTDYKDSLALTTVGFGNPSGDFSALEAMVETSNEATESSRANFAYCEKFAGAIGTAASSLATTLSDTRTSLIERGGAPKGPKRTVKCETETGVLNKWKFYHILAHRVYNPKSRRLERYNGVPLGALVSVGAKCRQARQPTYLAINVSSCGSGAERFAFRCRIADARSSSSFFYGEMVAKETNLVQRMIEAEKFHHAFCETQGIASFLAEEFNRCVRDVATSGSNISLIPSVSFLPCSVLVLDDDTVSAKGRSVLVEKKLDTEEFQWRKWNDNSGGVAGKQHHAPLDIEKEFRSIMKAQSRLDCFAEEESDEESVLHYEQDQIVPPEAYLQAFSHFTYIHTCCKLLVCDLQGVYNIETVPPKFELTDPAIHYRSSKGRKHVYGYTDRGENGVNLFFKTHRCTSICKLLKLRKSNLDLPTRNWRENWCKRHEEKFGTKTEPTHVNVLREKVGCADKEVPVAKTLQGWKELMERWYRQPSVRGA